MAKKTIDMCRSYYEELKSVALEALKEWKGGRYYRPELDFDRTRVFPYPSIRLMMARKMRDKGCSLYEISDVMGKNHSTISLGLKRMYSAINEGFDKSLTTLYVLFSRKLDEHNGTIPVSEAPEDVKNAIYDAEAKGVISSEARNFILSNI